MKSDAPGPRELHADSIGLPDENAASTVRQAKIRLVVAAEVEDEHIRPRFQQGRDEEVVAAVEIDGNRLAPVDQVVENVENLHLPQQEEAILYLVVGQ